MDVNFVLVGDGYLKPKFMRMIEDSTNVKFLGKVSDDALEELYKQAHLVCLPSVNTTEAYGLVLIEGALYGCLPLASDLIGVRENVRNLGGILFQPGQLKSLAKKILTLSNDTEMWRKISRQSLNATQNYVKTYTPDYYVRKHEEMFKRISETYN